MKKKFLCATAIIFMLVCSLASCDENDNGETAHTHSFEDWETTRSATCKERGIEIRYCACGESQTRATKKSTSHEYIDSVCSVCGEKKPSVGLDYTYVDNSYAVTGIGACTDSEVVVPSTTYDGKPVTSIAHSAFAGCTRFTSIVIPDSVTNIGDSAFAYCDSLTSIEIPDSVTNIGDSAFAYCDSLTSIEIPYSVTNIGDSAFAYCSSLTSVVIGDSVTTIGDNAFEDCRKLVEVINHSTLDITAGSSSYGYVGCYAIEVHKGESKIVNKNGYLFCTYNYINYLLGYTGKETELTLPESYNGKNYEIYDYAFYDCRSLTSVAIPDSVENIGWGAFSDCLKLRSVVIENGVKIIGAFAFASCIELREIVIPDSVTIIGGEAFRGCGGPFRLYINYKGTREQWDRVTYRALIFSPTAFITVICEDE